MSTILDAALAFGSGIFAAAIGGLGAFVMCGVLVVANMSDFAFGPYFGPHVSFAAGVGAVAYAGKKGLLPGNNLAVPLVKFNDSMILLVGGLFGIGGMVLQKVLAGIGTPTDTIAITVGISGIIARVLFGDQKVFSSYKIPGANELFSLILLGLGVGLLSAYVGIITKNVAIGFGIAAVTLVIPLFTGVGPGTHHIAMSAAVAAAATGNVWIGGLFGLAGAILGDFVGQTMNKGTTHIDPPAIVIAILTSVVILFLK